MSILLGIDIGTTHVRVAVVRAAYRRLMLEALATVDLAESGDVAEAISRAVAAALGGEAHGGDGLAVALPGVRAAIRTLEVPATAQKQLGAVLGFELDAQVPFDMDGAVFDYRVREGGHQGRAHGGPLTVLVAVARVEDVRARIDLVKVALVAEPERVEVGAFPVAHLAQFTAALVEPGATVLVDLGHGSSDVLVLEGGEPVFARTLSLGTHGLPDSAARLAREIRLSVGAYRAAGGEAPARVLLSGGGAFVSGAESFLSSELELPVTILPPPTLEMGPKAIEPMAAWPAYAKALGLALGLTGRGLGLNLRRGPLAYERGFGWLRERVPVLGGLAAVIGVSFLFSLWSQLYALSHERETLEKALATVSSEMLGESVTSAAQANDLLAQQTVGVDEDPMPHADAFDVMVRLSERVPTTVTHDIEELDVQKGHVVVHGIVASIPEAQSIATALGGQRCFSDVKISRTTQMVGGERQKYVLEFDLKCPEDAKGGTRAGAERRP